MPPEIDAPTLKCRLSDGREIALFDVREHGQYGMGHLFFSVPLPYSRFELGLPKLAPNAEVRIVLCDDGDGVATAPPPVLPRWAIATCPCSPAVRRHGAGRDIRCMRG
jgi:hypothetical protein